MSKASECSNNKFKRHIAKGDGRKIQCLSCGAKGIIVHKNSSKHIKWFKNYIHP